MNIKEFFQDKVKVVKSFLSNYTRAQIALGLGGVFLLVFVPTGTWAANSYTNGDFTKALTSNNITLKEVYNNYTSGKYKEDPINEEPIKQDISVEVVSSMNPFPPNTEISLKATVKNNDSKPSREKVLLTSIFPPPPEGELDGFEVIGVSATKGFCTTKNNLLECNLGVLSAGQSEKVIIKVKTSSSWMLHFYTAYENAERDVYTGSDKIDLEVDENLEIRDTVDLSLNSEVSKTSGLVGDKIKGNVVLANLGPSIARESKVLLNVQKIGTLKIRSANIKNFPSGNCEVGSYTTACELGELEALDEVEIELIVELVKEGNHKLHFTAHANNLTGGTFEDDTNEFIINVVPRDDDPDPEPEPEPEPEPMPDPEADMKVVSPKISVGGGAYGNSVHGEVGKSGFIKTGYYNAGPNSTDTPKVKVKFSDSSAIRFNTVASGYFCEILSQSEAVCTDINSSDDIETTRNNFSFSLDFLKAGTYSYTITVSSDITDPNTLDNSETYNLQIDSASEPPLHDAVEMSTIHDEIVDGNLGTGVVVDPDNSTTLSVDLAGSRYVTHVKVDFGDIMGSSSQVLARVSCRQPDASWYNVTSDYFSEGTSGTLSVNRTCTDISIYIGYGTTSNSGVTSAKIDELMIFWD